MSAVEGELLPPGWDPRDHRPGPAYGSRTCCDLPGCLWSVDVGPPGTLQWLTSAELDQVVADHLLRGHAWEDLPEAYQQALSAGGWR